VSDERAISATVLTARKRWVAWYDWCARTAAPEAMSPAMGRFESERGVSVG
jgi:hypothetical protein